MQLLPRACCYGLTTLSNYQAYIACSSRKNLSTGILQRNNMSTCYSYSKSKNYYTMNYSWLQHSSSGSYGSVGRCLKTRLFGSKLGSGMEGSMYVELLDDTPVVDQAYVTKSLEIIRELVGYETYDITLALGGDEFIRELNRDHRNMDKSTDILSFPFYDDIKIPGVLPDPDFDFEDNYMLGDLIVSVPYVIRRIDEDKKYFSSIDSQSSARSTDEIDGRLALQLSDERGVSGAMSREYNLEKRISLLLIHGILHLLGYDHIEDDDFLLMATREEEIISEWKLRMENEEG